MSEEVPAFVVGEEPADITDGLPKGFDGSCASFAQEFFEFGEGHLDGIEVWRIGRQEERPGSAILNDFSHTRPFVRGQIVHDNDIAFGKGWDELGLDIDLEGAAVHGAVQHPGRGKTVASEGADKSLGVPMTEGHIHPQSLAERCAPS